MVIYISFKSGIMRIFYGLAASLAILTACQPKTSQQTAAEADSVAATPAPPSTVYYKRLKGALAGQPVTMHLIRTGPAAFDGWYAYDNKGIPIQLFHDTDDSARLSFTEYTGADTDNTFKGALTAEGQYKGTWSGKDRSYEFDLQEDNTGAVLFKVFTCSDSVLLLPTNPASPMGVAMSSIVWPSGGADDATLNIIREAIAPRAAGMGPEKIVCQPLDTFRRDYTAVRDDVDTNALKQGTGASWNWDVQDELRIVWNTFPLLVLENSGYSFTGGAHGNYGSNFTVVDLARKQILHLDDVLKTGYKPVLGAALEKAFRKKYTVPAKEPLDKQFLFEPHIRPNDNFYITDKGIAFTYVPYEIAAYVFGQITLFVPFEEVKNYVNEVYLK